MDPLTFGPVMLKTEILMYMLSIAAGYVTMRSKISQIGISNLGLESIVTNAIFLSVLVWKLSLIVFDPVMIIAEPLSLVFYDGGVKGWCFASVVCASYLLYKRRKMGIRWTVFLEVLAVFWFGVHAAYQLLLWMNDISLWMIHLSASMLSMGMLVQFRKQLENSLTAMLQLLTWYFLGNTAILYFSRAADLVVGLNLEQIVYLCFAAVSITGSVLLERQQSIRGN